MVPKYECARVVMTESGPGTCETIYTDENGRRWITAPPQVCDGTVPVRRAQVRNGFICEHS